MAIITLVMIIIVFVVTVMACISDIRSLRIPNAYSLIVIACFIPAWIAEPRNFVPLWDHLAAMVIIFGITYAMFTAGMMGGGDSKFGTALGLWVGLKGLLPFVFYMALVGGLLGAVALGLRNRKLFRNPGPGSWVEQLQLGKNAVPYGVAISLGSWVSFLHTGFLDHQLNEVFKIIH